MKLFLVDDERVIVEGLQKMIRRYIPECEVIGVAYNSLEAVKLIQKLQPDIVITDIRMPQADGLDMIKVLKDAGNPAKFILLSGYADFEYARRGMQLGVQFYINKPVGKEELRDCVYKVMEAIRADMAKLQEVDGLKQEVHSRIQENALRDILDLGSENTELVEELQRTVGIPTEDSYFACVLFEFDGNIDVLKEIGLNPVYRQIDRVLGHYRKVFRFRYSGAQVAMVITHGSSFVYWGLVQAIQNLKDELYRELKLSVTIGIGTVQERPTGISQSFEEARYALSYKVIKGASAVIPYPEIMNLSGRNNAVPEEMIVKLEAGLDNMDEEECVGIIRKIFRGMEEVPGLGPADIQLQCLSILLSAVRKMSLHQLQQNKFLGRHILSLEGISRFRTLNRLEEWMIGVIKGIIAFKLEHNIPKKKDIITEIKAYVSQHYNEPINLQDLAARFFISPYYLSKLFKQKTGDTYMNFVAQIRIKKAKEFLEHTDLKIYEISQKVGYTDSQYFARLFEKLTGIKPSEYRKNLPRS